MERETQRNRHRRRERKTQTERHTNRETQTHLDTQTPGHKYILRQSDTHPQTDPDQHIQTHTSRHRDPHIHIKTHTPRDYTHTNRAKEIETHKRQRESTGNHTATQRQGRQQ